MKKEELIAVMQDMKAKREAEIAEEELDIKVVDIKYLGKIKWIDEIDGDRVEKEKDIFMIIEDRYGSMTYKYYDKNMEMIAAQLATDEVLFPDEKYINKEDKSFIDDINELDKEGESLYELEEEKEINKDEKEESKNDLTGKKPQNVIQTIDIDKAYIDNWTTVRKGFELPAGVDKIAIATPMQKDDNILSSGMTMYMLDNRGNIVESVDGKTIEDFFEIDDSTGNNPMYDDNTKLELEGYAEKNKGQTMMRFKSKENPELYLSAEQKEVGQYVEVYAGRKTRDGNDAVEVQLETDNVEVQTSLEMQQIISSYKGEYNKENIDKEADFHEKHGDDEMKIAKENADGDELTREICGDPFVPDTNITWEQFSKSVGDKDIKELSKEFFEKYDGNNGQELVLEMQSEYKEKEEIEQTEEKEIEDEYEGRVPWDSTKH